MIAVFDILLLIAVIFIGIPLTARFRLISRALPPGPSLLTRFLERRSNELLAVKFMRWGKIYGELLRILNSFEGNQLVVLRWRIFGDGFGEVWETNNRYGA